MEEAEDLALMRSIARRDRGAFETLYSRYAPRLSRYAFRLLRRQEAVEEVVDDAMLVVWNEAGRFDAGISRLPAWLFGIVHNKALKMLQRWSPRAREVPIDGEDGATQHDGQSQDPERAAIGRQLGETLANALQRLPPEQRAVIELAFGEGQSYHEISVVLGCPVNTVKTRMFHARKRLARILEEQGETARSRLP